MMTSTTIPMERVDLREQVDLALEYLSKLLQEHAATGSGSHASNDLDRLQALARFLGQVTAGWPNVPAGALPAEGAGFGSTVTVTDIEGRGREPTP